MRYGGLRYSEASVPTMVPVGRKEGELVPSKIPRVRSVFTAIVKRVENVQLLMASIRPTALVKQSSQNDVLVSDFREGRAYAGSCGHM